MKLVHLTNTHKDISTRSDHSLLELIVKKKGKKEKEEEVKSAEWLPVVIEEVLDKFIENYNFLNEFLEKNRSWIFKLLDLAMIALVGIHLFVDNSSISLS